MPMDKYFEGNEVLDEVFEQNPPCFLPLDISICRKLYEVLGKTKHFKFSGFEFILHTQIV